MNLEQSNKELESKPKKGFFRKFSSQFWLVVMFEFFERGAYYGMMSFISVYFTDTLNIPKENVGIIKGVIQPLLYFLPIISGAVADRFGYRKVLMVAFTLLGGGYFLTSQMTTYTAVFGALVIMGFGAGAFKPLISGTIAKITDESNSTQAFGIYYWSINMGAFLFPLILVPILKSINPTYVIIASAICTAVMILPTVFFFKEPSKQKEVEDKTKKREQATMIQTLANAFEIIYSPIILLYNLMKKSISNRNIVGLILIVLLVFSGWQYFHKTPESEKFAAFGIDKGNTTLIFTVNRNMQKEKPYKLEVREKTPSIIDLTIYKPQQTANFIEELIKEFETYPDLVSISKNEIKDYIIKSDNKIELIFELDSSESADFRLEKISNIQYKIFLKNADAYHSYKENILKEMHKLPTLRGITQKDCDRLHEASKGRSFFLFFVISLILIGLIIVTVTIHRSRQSAPPDVEIKTSAFQLSRFIVPVIIISIWFLPGLNMLGRIVCSVLYFSIMSLFIIDKSDTHKFVDHGKFLLMIVLYAGFWVLYFQMFDSVLWYVQAYVDATSLNNVVNSVGNSVLGIFGIKINWFFDVEHVTVINAGTIIVLQLIISSIVKNKKAMPTMITGIVFATIGMAMLAVSTHIWVFIAGIVIFSIGEMTAHPKFISYVGLTAPSDKKAMYMGYIFLYGVFGSSVGGIVGAKLYVHFVDNLNQPRVLWLVFASIGVITIISLLLYNKFLVPKKTEN